MSLPQFYTATMAKLYADQGYLRKAAQIYDHLLQQEPDREDLRLALEQVNQLIVEQAGPTRRELGLLMKEWAGLIKKQKDRRRR